MQHSAIGQGIAPSFEAPAPAWPFFCFFLKWPGQRGTSNNCRAQFSLATFLCNSSHPALGPGWNSKPVAPRGLWEMQFALSNCMCRDAATIHGTSKIPPTNVTGGFTDSHTNTSSELLIHLLARRAQYHLGQRRVTHTPAHSHWRPKQRWGTLKALCLVQKTC